MTVYIYGYLTGAGRSTILDVDKVNNVLSSSTSGFDRYSMKPINLPATGVTGLLTTTTTYVTTLGDHYNVVLGRDSDVPLNYNEAPYTSTNNYWGDSTITSEGDKSEAKNYYGTSSFLVRFHAAPLLSDVLHL